MLPEGKGRGVLTSPQAFVHEERDGSRGEGHTEDVITPFDRSQTKELLAVTEQEKASGKFRSDSDSDHLIMPSQPGEGSVGYKQNTTTIIVSS